MEGVFIMTETKICTKCNKQLTADKTNFRSSSKGKLGLGSSCKDCEKKQSKLYRENNKKKLAEYNKKYYEENHERCLTVRSEWRNNNSEYFKQYRNEHKEISKAYAENYYDENKEELNQYKNSWYIKNKDRIIIMRRVYKRNNRDKAQTWGNKRRTMKAKLEHSFTTNDWKTVMSEFNHECAYCGEEKKLTQDHFIPLYSGGEFTINNVIPACINCNSSKSNKSFDVWYPTYKYYSKHRERKILEFLNYNKNKEQQLSILL